MSCSGMNKRRFLFPVIPLIFLSCLAHAEGNCPPGYTPIGSPAPGAAQGCAPLPDSSAATSQSSFSWKSAWGAIVTDGDKGVLGTTVNKESRQAAESGAMSACISKGGERCKLQLSYVNGCGAMIAGTGGFATWYGNTEQEAIAAATKICASNGDTTCRVLYSECSLPQLQR